MELAATPPAARRDGHPRDRLGRRPRDLRISVIDRCNFRCPYCMPKETYGDDYEFLPPADYLTFAEIEAVCCAMVALGVAKIRLTGGEPLLRPGISTLVEALAAIDGIDDLALTTNGFLLPQHAARLKDAGLHRVTVSLDSLDPRVFAEMNGLGLSIERVLEGIAAARQVGLTPIKLNAVVQRGVNDHTVVDLVRHFRGTGVTVRFIEYMDVGTLNQWDGATVVPSAELMRAIDAEFPLEPVPAAYGGEVAERYRLRDGSGEVGFISSITQPFCGSCTRARLATDGKLYTCLFSGAGTDLRQTLRSAAAEGELMSLLERIWSDRQDRYSEERAEVAAHVAQRDTERVEMFQIGG